MRILLAEDDPHIALILQICLEKIGGHEVTVRHDGQSALTAARTGHYNLILLDGSLPRLSGLELARELFKTKRVSSQIIFLTANSDQKELNQMRALSAGIIAKPFDPQTICARLGAILDDSGAAAA